MMQFLARLTNPKPGKAKFIQEYDKIKKRCQFQKNFSQFLLGFFFVLQYSVPIFLVVLGSIASSKEQLTILFSQPDHAAGDPKSATGHASMAEGTISRIIYFIGLFTILLGVVNNIVRPAESYDNAARYNNEFWRFEQNLDLRLLEILASSTEAISKDTEQLIIRLLIQKNDELCQLIADYNEARSLSPRQASLQRIIQAKSKGSVNVTENSSDSQTPPKQPLPASVLTNAAGSGSDT